MKEFNAKIYGEEAIQAATSAFSGFAKIVYISNSDYNKCFFLFCKYNLQKTIKEFENYMIDFLNCKG